MGAVEWLVNQYEQKIGKSISSVMADEIKQAKAMEEEQRIKDIDFGHGIPSWVDVNHEAYFKLSNKSGNEAEKLPTFELTEEGKIEGITLCTASSEDRKVVLLVEDEEGNFYKLGKDAEFHPLPKIKRNPKHK